MAKPVEELYIAITADTEEAISGIQKVDNELNKTEQQSKKTADGFNATKDAAQTLSNSGLRILKNAATGLLVTLSGLAVGFFSLATAVREFNEYISEANKLELLKFKTGIDTSELDAWGKAAEAAGGSAEALYQSLSSFYAKTGRDASQFFQLGEKIEGMSEGQKRRFLMAQGVSLDAVPLFMRPREQQKALVNRYREGAMTDEDVRNAREYKMVAYDLREMLKDTGTEIARVVLPMVKSLTETVRDLVSWIKENARFIGATFVTLLIIKLAPALMAVASAAFTATGAFGFLILKLGASAFAMNGTFIPALKACIPVLGYLGKAISLNFLPLTAIVAAIAAVALTLEDLYVFAKGGGSLFGQMFADDPEMLEDMRDAINSVLESISELWQTLKDSGIISGVFKTLAMGVALLAKVLTWVVGKFAQLIELVGALPTNIFNLFRPIGQLFGWLAEKWESLKSIVTSIGSFLPHGVIDFFTPSKEKNAENVSSEQARYSNKSSTVNTNANLSVTNNFGTTPNNPKETSRVVNNGVAKAMGGFGNMVAQSASGVNV